MKKLKVGVLGLGSIFHRVMADFMNAENCELYAVAARDPERAEAEAKKYGAAKAYGSYEDMLNDPEVELVYVATPHRFHKEHTIMSLEHGKHVICEKPFAMNADEAEEMVACARKHGLFLMDAVWTRFLPAIRKFMEMYENGDFGRILHIMGDFAYASKFDPKSRLFDPELGGGALMDVGIYLIATGAMMLGTEIEQAQCQVIHAPTGVDARALMQFKYAGGATAQYMAGMDVTTPNNMTVYTEKAVVELPGFWHCTEIIVNGESIKFAPEHEGHHYEFVYAANDIRNGLTEDRLMPLDETIKIMRLMDKLRKDMAVVYPTDK